MDGKSPESANCVDGEGRGHLISSAVEPRRDIVVRQTTFFVVVAQQDSVNPMKPRRFEGGEEQLRVSHVTVTVATASSLSESGLIVSPDPLPFRMMFGQCGVLVSSVQCDSFPDRSWRCLYRAIVRLKQSQEALGLFRRFIAKEKPAPPVPSPETHSRIDQKPNDQMRCSFRASNEIIFTCVVTICGYPPIQMCKHYQNRMTN
jgi:hypothetical protein